MPKLDGFSEYIGGRLRNIGYTMEAIGQTPSATTLEFKNIIGAGRFFIIHLWHAPGDSENIRDAFKFHSPAPVLFVVNEQLLAQVKLDITSKKSPPLWFRALHAIYYGRVYVWRGMQHEIQAMHVDWAKNDFSYSETVVINKVIYTQTDSLLRDFPGVFQIVRFADRAFWKGERQAPPKRKSPKYDTYEDFARGEHTRYEHEAHHQKPPEPEPNIYEEFMRHKREQDARQAREQSQRNQYQYNYNRYNQPPPCSGHYAGDEYFSQMMAAGTLAGAKQVYRKLGLQYHPDHNKSPNATEVMQKINRAYEEVERILK